MFPSRDRIPKKTFPAVLSGGKRLSSAHLSVIIPNKTKGYAVVIPKKTLRLSVDRHRIKRRVLAALRTVKLPPAVIVFPKASAGSVSYKEIQKELTDLLKTNTTP